MLPEPRHMVGILFFGIEDMLLSSFARSCGIIAPRGQGFILYSNKLG